ncbi:hypothetical protein KGP40_04305 [Weissella cibaria]|uniref:hypothetical protein n=1 Tax=Weissella cibaria TaxID=137591 RepID=UPI001C200085|nr:hypothetical protein [Weissella cibaria]MBU7561137.1 hypothetical protein [Weissella cibaria]
MSKRIKAVAYIEAVIFALEMLGFLFKNFKPIDVMNYLFSTGGPSDAYHFQWVGVTAAVALVAFIFNQVWERRKMKADLKSKNSIIWLDTVRPILADLMVASIDAQLAKYEFEYNSRKGLPQVSVAELEKSEKLFEDKLSSLDRSYSLLQLYIPESESTANLLYKIEGLYGTTKSNLEKLENVKSGTPDEPLALMAEKNDGTDRIKFLIKDELIPVAKTYFNKEWVQATRGE